MILRPFWLKRIEESWRVAPIVWLCGVRRVGKTTLAEGLGPERILYINCDLPIVEEMLMNIIPFHLICENLRNLRTTLREISYGT